VIAFSQSTVPALAAAAMLAEAGTEPRTITLVAGPLDVRINTTAAQALVARQPSAWFASTLISRVPAGYAGCDRRVLPGFIQLAGYMSHGFDRHIEAHWDFFGRLVRGDKQGADAHRRFYDRFFSVLDLTEEYFLATLEGVFQRQDLARGKMDWKGLPIDLGALRSTALLTVEGAEDDVSSPGQTVVAHDLCPNVSALRRAHHLEPGAGHLALFYGHHWRDAIAPRITSFVRQHA